MIALIAWRGGSETKSRLGAVLPPEQRAALAGQLLAQVATAVRCSAAVTRAHIVSPTLPPTGGDCWIPDEGWGLNAAFAHALALLPPEPVLLLPADLPYLSSVAVDRFIIAAPEGGVAIMTDAVGHGTNALLLPHPGAILPAFGPGSAARHRLLAEGAGLRVTVCVSPDFDDIDTPEDLHRYQALTEGSAHAC